MKLTKENEKALIAGMLEMLLPATYTVTNRRFGSTLIEKGVTKDAHGKSIEPKLLYTTKEPFPINHTRALKKMIKKAKTNEEMQKLLAEYLVKYGRRKDRMELSSNNQT